MTPAFTQQLRVVLVATRNPLNIGAAARAMSNFGFSRLRVVTPYDAAYREARSAVGAPQLLKEAAEFATVAEAVADCGLVVGTTAGGKRQPSLALHPLEAGARAIRGHLETSPAALLFGSEKRGLSNADFSYCHWLLRISTRTEHASMNLGQAVAVCLYELSRDFTAAANLLTVEPASAESLDRLTQALYGAMHQSGYVKQGAETNTLEKTRKMIRRLSLGADDADSLTGVMAKIRGALGRDGKS